MGRVKTACRIAVLSLLIWPLGAQAADPPPSRPIHIQADILTYSKATQTYEGKGAVVVVQGPLRMEADEAALNMTSGQLTAVGHVHLNDGFHDIHGQRLDLNINTTKGVIFHGRLYIVEGNFTIDGEVMERLSESKYRIEDLSFTTCNVLEGERTPWSLKATKAELETEGFLFARNVKFCILDVPVMYLPVVLFPVKQERATGLLIPTVGASSRQGLKIHQGFFWAISPHQDATIAVDHRGKLGTGGDLEYRYYYSATSDGRFWGRYFRDSQLNATRWDLIYRHTTKFSEDLQGRIDLNYVNQKDTFRQLSENVLQRVAVYQESQAYLTKRWDNNVLYGLTRFSQNLSALSDKTVLQTLPQIGYTLSPVRLLGSTIYTGFDSTFSSFYREEGIDARRVDLFPRIWTPLSAGRYFTLTPLIGFRETYYSRSLQSDQSTSREALYMSATLDTRLARRYSVSGGSILHKIEPTVTYEYLPQTRQAEIPVFDDLDRFTKKDLLTYGLTNRLSTSFLDGDTVRHMEFGYLRMTQSQRVTASPTGKPFSDLRSELILRTAKPVSTTLDVDTFYNHEQSAVTAVNTDLTFELPKRGFIGVGQRFSRAGAIPVRGDLFNPLSLNESLTQTQTTHFYTVQAGVALPYNFYAVVRGYYDRNDGVFPEINYGLYYVGADRCWGVGALMIQRPDQTEFAFLFTLGGIGFTDSPFSGVYRGLFQRLGLDIQKLR